MMKLSRFKQKLAAMSLAEVLVVLAIAAVTLVSISQLTVRLLVTIKNDEIEDYTTGISLQALEIAKNADDIILAAATPISRVSGQYKIDFSSTPASLYRVSPANGGATITNCTEQSTYHIAVDVPNVGQQPLVCMQVIIEETQDSLDQDYYLLTAVTVTKLGNDIRISEFQGYRRGEFDVTSTLPGGSNPPPTQPPPPPGGSQSLERCYPYGRDTQLCCTYEGGQATNCETRPL